jgi:hypothetical protein
MTLARPRLLALTLVTLALLGVLAASALAAPGGNADNAHAYQMNGGTFNGGDQVDVVFNHVGGTFNQEGT